MSTAMRPCGNPRCRASSLVDEVTVTFGSGRLDDYGLWERGCVPCAAAHKARHPEASVWPEPDESEPFHPPQPSR